MGHYAGGHTVFGVVVYRGGTSIAATITRIGPRQLGGLVLTGFAAVYFLVALKVMRVKEFEADQAAARIAGGTPTREVLAALPVLAATWEDALRRYLAAARTMDIVRPICWTRSCSSSGPPCRYADGPAGIPIRRSRNGSRRYRARIGDHPG